MSITTPDKQGGAAAPSSEPNVPIAQPDAFVPPWDVTALPPAPNTPAPQKSRGLIGTIMLLVLVVIAVVGFKLLVHTAASAVVSTLPGSGTNPGPVTSVPAASQPATVANPALPLAASPEGVVRAVEAYRNKAYATGDMSQLENYYVSHNDAWQRDNSEIVTQGLRAPKMAVVKVDLISQNSTQIVANVTYYNGLGPNWTLKNTYQVLPQTLASGTVNRWFLTDQAGV